MWWWVEVDHGTTLAKSLSPFLVVLLWWCNQLPKSPPLNNVILGIRISIYEFGEYKHSDQHRNIQIPHDPEAKILILFKSPRTQAQCQDKCVMPLFSGYEVLYILCLWYLTDCVHLSKKCPTRLVQHRSACGRPTLGRIVSRWCERERKKEGSLLFLLVLHICLHLCHHLLASRTDVPVQTLCTGHYTEAGLCLDLWDLQCADRAFPLFQPWLWAAAVIQSCKFL